MAKRSSDIPMITDPSKIRQAKTMLLAIICSANECGTRDIHRPGIHRRALLLSCGSKNGKQRFVLQ